MAPEMITGSYNNTVDFWSLDVLLFHMFSGDYSFKSHEDEGIGLTIFKSIVNEDMPNINEIYKKNCPEKEEITETACDFVKQLLNKDLNKRLGSISNPQNIKQHQFYSSIDWIQLENGVLEPHLKPNVIYF